MSVFNELVGHRVNGVFVAEENWVLAFRTTESKWFCYRTQNDCCNSVWFNHVTGINCVGDGANSFDLLRGALVTGTEDKGWGDNREDPEHDVVQDGFWTIKTDRGYIDIEVRNSHNGYYGGNVSYDEDADIATLELTAVVDDF